jgi:ATP-binding cassette subfamily B protein
VRHFWPHLRTQRLVLAASFTALLIEVCLRSLEPWPLKLVFDQLLGHRRGHSAAGALARLEPTTLLALCVAAMIVIAAVRALADYGSTIGFALVGMRVLTEVRDKVYRHLQSLSLSFHAKGRTGDMMLRVISDVSTLKDVTVNAALPLTADLLILVGMVAVMFWVNAKLALLVLAAVPVFWLCTRGLGRRVRLAARQQRQRQGALAATAAESIGAVQLVQTFALEDIFARLFAGQNQKCFAEDWRTSRLAAAFKRAIEALVAAATALVVWYGTRLVMRNELSPGDLVVFLAYLKTGLKSVQNFARYTARLAKAAAAGERMLDVLERTPDVRDLPGALPAPPLLGGICFAGVHFAYEPGHWVLRGIDFNVAQGERVAVVGPSGIGKSTLANLLLRLYDPVRGRVLVDGRDIREYTLASVRSQMSVVLQDCFLFASPIRENIAYGAPGCPAEEVEAAARLANAHEFICALPSGYDTVLGERGVSLSRGQRQRVAIARAAVRKTPILVLDEATAGLDEENGRAVGEALERLARGRTCVLITHDLQLAARADRILYLDKGVVVEQGTHAELMAVDGRYAALYRLQTTFVSPVDSDAVFLPCDGVAAGVAGPRLWSAPEA